MRRGEYGYDAPYALVIFGLVALVTGLGGGDRLVAFVHSGRRTDHVLFCLLPGEHQQLFLHHQARQVPGMGADSGWPCLRGDEMVLDMGCGRGAVLTAVARRLTTGRVTGVDIWSTTDQSGNAKDVTLRNASLEGVSDRVRIETADMRELPFPDATFDLVVSSLAIHNIRSNADRKRAISEGFRVLETRRHGW